MQPERHQQLKALVDAALDLPAATRAAWLQQACAGDAELLAEAARWLAAVDAAEAGDFLASLAHGDELTGGAQQRYRLLRVIGSGGMGTVYLAERADGEYRQQVALKTLNLAAADDADLILRLRGERQILAQLQHPHIARLLDGGTDAAGRPFLVMEYVAGERIDRWCDSHALDTDARVELFLRVCDAVHYAHSQLVVHRDIKPGNILVGDDGQPKLLDFGIAKLLADEATATATVEQLLSFRYASPEQIRGERVGTASDVYSLAVVLYRLLTGRLPYANEGASAPEIARAVLYDEPCTPSRSATLPLTPQTPATALPARELGGDLDAILLKALRKEPGQRYASVLQFVEDLQRQREGLPVLARQGQRGYVLRRLLRRHRWAVLAALAALALLLGFTVTLKLQLDRTALQRDRANQVAQFFADMFGQSNPLADVAGSSALRANISVREVLDREAPRIERELASQPEVQATLLASIGRVYAGLDQRDAAERYLALALQRLDAVSATPSRAKLAVATDLCEVLGIRGRETTVAACASAVALGRALARGDDADLARALRGHGAALKTVGRWDAAEADLGEALGMSERLQLPEAVAGVRDHLAEVAYLRGDRQRCLDILAPAIEQWRSHYGTQHALLAGMLTTRAHCSTGLGQVAAAEADLREALALIGQAMGADAAVGVRSQLLTDLGLVLNQTDRFAEAEPYLQEALRINEALYGSTHPELATTLSNLATSLDGQGRSSEAFALMRRAITLHRQRSGSDRRLLAVSLGNLGYLLWREGQYAEAESLLRESLQTYVAIDPQHPDRAATLISLGTLLVDTQRAAEALPLLREGVALRQARLPPGNWRLETARSSLGACLHALGEDAEAGPLLQSSYEALRKDMGESHRRTRDALRRWEAFQKRG